MLLRPVDLTEAEFQLKITRYAEDHGWAWLHIPRGKVGKVWLTRAKGPLARGWFDLLLIRDRRAIGAELKRKGGVLKPDQEWVAEFCSAAIEVYSWWPKDWEEIERVLL